MSGSLSLSSPPVKDDIMRIASAMADVLRLPKDDLNGRDAAGVCEWLRANMPNLDGDKKVTEDAPRQRNLCQKLSLVLGDSAQQREACGALAGHWCSLACSVKSALDSIMANLDAKIASCGDPECKSRMQECKSRMSSVCAAVSSQKEIIESFARTADEKKEAVGAKDWSTKMTAALSSVPTLAEMINVVCDSCAEIEALCAGCKHESVSGGDCGCDESSNLFTGGFIHGGHGVSGGLTIDSRVRKQTDERKKAMREFRVKAEDLFNRVLRAVYALGQRMGKGAIAMNDDMLRFVNSFSELENVYTPGIEYALTGFYVHPTAVEQRERFLGKLQALISTLGPLAAGANGDVFREIKTPLEELQRHCDQYSDKFRSSSSGLIQTRYGNPVAGGDFKSFQQGLGDTVTSARDALHKAPNVIKSTAHDIADVKQAVQDAAVTIGRGDQFYDDDITVGGEMTKLGLTLQNVTKSLNHFYRVSKMRDNFKKVASESKLYSANYSEVLGKPFAALIDKERKAFEKFKEELESPLSQSYVYGSVKIPVAAAYGTIKKAVEFGSTGGDNITTEWNKEAISTMQLNSCEARIGLYNVIQAIDLALMNFTDRITVNPDEVGEISKILDSTEIIAEWFNEASGDHVAGLFEYMPSVYTPSIDTGTNKPDGNEIKTHLSPLGKGPLSIIDDKGSRLKKFTSGHYLKEVKNAIDDTKMPPGNPFFMISPARAEYAREFARKTVERMLSLKNIVSAFAYMSSKGKSGESMLWEPARIYAALCKYLYVSAFAMGWDGYNAGSSGDDKTNQQFAQRYVMGAGSMLTGVLPFDNSKPWSQLINPGPAFGTARFTEYEGRKAQKKQKLEDTLAAMEAKMQDAVNTRDQALAAAIMPALANLRSVMDEAKRQGITLESVRSKLVPLKTEILNAMDTALRAKIAATAQNINIVNAGPILTSMPGTLTIVSRAPAILAAIQAIAPVDPTTVAAQTLVIRALLDGITDDIINAIAPIANLDLVEFKDAKVRAATFVTNFVNMAGAAALVNVKAEEQNAINSIVTDVKAIWRNKRAAENRTDFELNIEQKAEPVVVHMGTPVAPATAGGAVSGFGTHNWIEYCDALEQTGQTRGWLIAFNPGDGAKNLTTVPPFARCAFGCAMNSIPLPKDTPGPFKTVGGWSSQFRETDALFTRAIKAMVAKVMTVSGLFNMLNFASAEDHTMSATRFTIGGGSHGISSGGVDSPASSHEMAMVPQIHDEAVELYIRLPLLVEFYRDVFSLTGRKLNDDMKNDQLIVALVPDMDLTWSSLMRLSFDNLGGSVVTKSYAAQMINEINVIYDKYKSRAGSNLVSTVVNDFIADVNSRFGIMTRLESIKYTEMMQANRRAFTDANSDDILVDFDTLGDQNFSERKAAELPSDKFTKSTAGTSLGDSTEFKLGFIEALSKFRTHIDDKIRKATFEGPAGLFQTGTPVKSDFHEQARITKNDLKLATTPEQRFNVVYSVMSGIDSVQKIDDNSHVMFHEMIMAPLAILQGISAIMDRFVADVKTVWDEIKQAPDEAKMNGAFIAITRIIMSHVSSLSGLVDMEVQGSKVVIDHSDLQRFAEGLLEFVSRNIQKFRGTVDRSIIDGKEDVIKNLQTHLVEEVFRNETNDPASGGLEKASRWITRMYGIFAKNADVYHDGDDEVKLNPPHADPKGSHFFSYCNAVRYLAYYNPESVSAAFADTKCVLTRDGRLEKLFMKKVDGKDVYMYEDLMFASRWEIYESKHEFSTDSTKSTGMGLMMRYNELLARYLEQFWDESNRKIYMPMITTIASSNDAAVHKAAGWPDLVMPLGHSNLPETVVSGPKWAEQLEGKFIGGLAPAAPGGTWSVSFEVQAVAATPEALVAHRNFINMLNTSSTAMAPVQLVNVLRHAFDQAASGLSKERIRALEAYRNQTISAIGENWVKYGPIAAVAASSFALAGGSRPTTPAAPGAVALDKALKDADYKAPLVVPAPMSELSGVNSDIPFPKVGNPDEIMFASVAKVIQTMLTTQDKGVPLYVLPSLSDSSATAPRMKENIRANLPIFTKMFGMLAESCKILGNILSTGVNVDDVNTVVPGAGLVVANAGVHGRVFDAHHVDGGAPLAGPRARQYLSRILGKIASSANAVVTTGIEVMKEVSDNPLYLETSENSISAYRNITNVSPFMPLSSMMIGIWKPTGGVLMPIHSPGSRMFEFNYGTRFILGNPKVGALLDHAPGVREIVENYNKMVQNDKHITLENVQRAVSEIVQISRWMADLNVYAPILFPRVSATATAARGPPPPPPPPLPSNLLYQTSINITLDDVLDLTTNTDKKRAVATLAEWVSKKGASRDVVLDREKMQIWNIMDLNINPINMNALRREVPLLNMLNYSLTFDAFMKDILGTRDSSLPETRSMFLALALDPYRQKGPGDWKTIFNCFGDASASLGFGGHDRFAQDQIFRKALLYSGEASITNASRQRTHTESGYKYPSKGNYGMNRSAANTQTVEFTDTQKEYLDILGQMRHDTSFIRNILFISVAHRVMRKRIGDEMNRITFPVVSGPPAVSMHITDENVWETYDDVRQAYH